MRRLHIFMGVLFIFALAGVPSFAQETPSDLSEVVFYVHWYDVGKAALEGLPGVKQVKRGWHKRREINTVTYDPSKVSVEQMVTYLKDAGTFAGVVE